jgi:nitrate reductase gamma subunit
MMAVLATGMIGMVLAMRGPVAVWFVAGLAVIACAIISSSSVADALFQAASWLVAYNLGLALGLATLELLHCRRLQQARVRARRR